MKKAVVVIVSILILGPLGFFQEVIGFASSIAQTSGTTNLLRSVDCPDANTCYAVGAAGTIRKTTNGGSNWNAQTSGTTNLLRSVDCPDANTCYAVGAAGTIRKTTNGGSNWNAQTSGTTDGLLSVDCLDANTCYAVGGSSTIIFPNIIIQTIFLKTTDGGTNWIAQPGFGVIGNSIDCLDVNTCYAVAASGRIFKTTDGGTNWSFHDTSPTNFFYSVDCLDVNTCYVAGEGGPPNGKTGIIYKTTDGGTNWSVPTFGTTSLLSSVDCLDANTCYAVSDSGTILKTINGDTNWIAVTSGTTSSLSSVDCLDANTCYIVGSSGTILKTIEVFLCGTGTMPQGNECISLESSLSCGTNTMQIDDECVGTSPQGFMCGDGTIADLIEGKCFPNFNVICGQGTGLEQGMCIAINMGNIVGGTLLDIDTTALLIASIGTNPVITSLVGITIAGIAGQAIWYVRKRRKSEIS